MERNSQQAGSSSRAMPPAAMKVMRGMKAVRSMKKAMRMQAMKKMDATKGAKSMKKAMRKQVMKTAMRMQAMKKMDATKGAKSMKKAMRKQVMKKAMRTQTMKKAMRRLGQAMKKASRGQTMKKADAMKDKNADAEIPNAKTGVGRAFVRPSWISNKLANEVIRVPIDTRGVPELRLFCKHLHTKLGFAPNLERVDVMGTKHVLRNVGGTIDWIKVTTIERHVLQNVGSSTSEESGFEEDMVVEDPSIPKPKTGIGKEANKPMTMSWAEAKKVDEVSIDVRGIPAVISV